MSYPIAEQTSRQLWFAFKRQAVKGTIETGAGGKLLPFTSSAGLLQEYADVQSQISRSDLQSQLGDYGQGSAPLAFDSELIIGAHEDLDAAVLRSAYVAAATVSEADVGTITGISGRVITFSDTDVSTFFRRGDLITPLTGLAAGDLNKHFVVADAAASTLTLDVAPVSSGAIAAFTIRRQSYCNDAETDCAFTVEQYFRNLDASLVAEGARLSEFTLSSDPNQQVRRTWAGRARQIISRTGSDAPALTSPTQANGLSISSANASVIIDGVRVGNLSASALTYSRPNFLPPTSGLIPEDIGLGSVRATGTITLLKTSNAYEIEFLARKREFSIGILIEQPGADPRAAALYYLPYCRWTGARPSQAGADAFTTIQLPFEAGADPRGGASFATTIRLSTTATVV